MTGTASPPDNQVLAQAMRELAEAPEYDAERFMRPVLEAFVQATLIVADDDALMTVEGEDGGTYLALFTDLIELSLFEANVAWATISAEDAIRSVADGEVDGMIVNPAGTQLELSKEDVLDFFDIDPA